LLISFLKWDSSKIEQFGKLINYAADIIVLKKSKFTGQPDVFALKAGGNSFGLMTEPTKLESAQRGRATFFVPGLA